MTFLLPPLIAVLGGVLLPFLPLRKKARDLAVFFTTLFISFGVLYLLIRTPEDATVLQITQKFAFSFGMDALSKVFCSLMAFLWPIAVLYALEYMEHESRQAGFFGWYLLSYAAALLLAMAKNLFTMYVFYEMLTICTLPLVAHKGDTSSSFAARRYLEYTIGGAALGFVGVILLSGYGDGIFRAGGFLENFAGQETFLRILFVICFVGFGAKAAIVPLHSWLPLASVAPTPVTALLHAAAVVKAGAFACIRIVWYSFGTDLLRGTWAQDVCMLLSAITIVYGAIRAVRQNHLKRRLAWSTVSNLSYILFATCLMTEAGLSGALIHLVGHAVMKITLFFCAGAIMIYTGRENLPDIRGVARTMPGVCAAFALAAAALTGVPPLPGFLSKWSILNAAAEISSPCALIGLIAMIISTILTALYALTPAVHMFFTPRADWVGERDCGLRMKITLAVLCVTILVISFCGASFTGILENVAHTAMP